MYQTLYRKYRPTEFDEVIGQDIIIKTIKNAIKNNKLTHAYIFNGPRGTGKTSTAKIIAKTINCLNLEELKPCNKCINCTQIQKKQSMDIIEIDAASNNGVDEIRELRNSVNLVPSTGKYKIYIIDEVHMLTIGAFNALLKTLEEPPEHVIFILATTEIHKIPDTILSRCQRFDFKKISVKKITEKLNHIIKEEKIKIKEDAVLEIARLSDGGMRDALSILDQVSSYENNMITLDSIHEINGTIPQYQLKNFINFLIKKDYNQIFKTIDLYNNDGKNFIKLAEEIILFYRNILLTLTAKEYVEENVSNFEIYEDMSLLISEDEIIDNIKFFNEAIGDMKKSNNPKLLFETIIIKILNNNKTEKKVEEDIEKIEKKKISKNININYEENKNIDYNFLNKLVNIRINNTLCSFNKNILIEMKTQIDQVRVMLMNPEYSEIASLLLEGQLKAVGNNNLIFIYEDKRLTQIFNENLKKIQELLKKVYNEDYKPVATDINNWNNIKDEFNNKKKIYEYLEEPDLENLYKKIDIDQ